MGNLRLAKARIGILVTVIFGVLILFAIQLVRVQVIQAGDYQEKAALEMQTTRVIPAPRGEITDINGVSFARSVSAINIVVDQTQITDPARVAEFVAPILNLPAEDIETSITGTRKYAIVLRNARPAMWESLTKALYDYNKVLENKDLGKRIIGFFPERVFIREYPSGELISSLIGFVRADGVGASGIESGMNSVITGTEGRYSYARGYGAEIPGSQQELVAAKAGTNVRLTIDRDVQWVAAEAIATAVKQYSASSGTVIVMDPKTGAVIAHATAPTRELKEPSA